MVSGIFPEMILPAVLPASFFQTGSSADTNYHSLCTLLIKANCSMELTALQVIEFIAVVEWNDPRLSAHPREDHRLTLRVAPA